MKKQFINLFNYDLFANRLILDAINETNRPAKTIQLFAHLLAAQQVWLNRCLGLPHANVELWPALGADPGDLHSLMTTNHEAWVNYLANATDSNFDQMHCYKTTRGDSFENLPADMITQVLNHGTHHRAQIGQLLKQAGLQNLPATDYILYLRQL
jgi:uncharacterized damage-inducible protein DinB